MFAAQPRRYLATTCTALRRPVFSERWLATEVTGRLRQDAASFDFVVQAYCLMPDHLHVLLEATSERADLLASMTRFKQTTGVSYRQQTKRQLWQPGYHERRLRDEEASDAVARYVLENPVRAGLTNALGEYRFAWSDVYGLEGLLTAWEETPLCRARRDGFRTRSG